MKASWRLHPRSRRLLLCVKQPTAREEEALKRSGFQSFLRLLAKPGKGANVVSRRMRSAGLGRRRSVPGAPKLPRPQCPRRPIEDLLIVSLFARVNPTCQDSKSVRWWELH